MRSMPKIYQNYINGNWVNSRSGKTFPDINPADNTRIIGHFQQSTKEDVTEAIDVARKAFISWRKLSFPERAEFFYKAVSLIKEKKNELAEILTQEQGKTLAESHKEIQSGIKEMEYQAGLGRKLFAKITPSEKEDILCYTIREPLGVVAIISPWNFPFNVPCRKITPALIAGNTVVFKPASFTPLIGLKFVEILNEAGIPEGVLNFITGSGSSLGDELITNPSIKAISFTGSTAVGLKINEKAIATRAKVQLEMGGKNPALILEDADLELAADEVSFAAFSCSGQWCTSTSRAIIMESIKDRFIGLLLERVKKIKLGDGLKSGITMGPLAGESQLKTVMDYIELGKKEGASIIIGGRHLTDSPYDKGYFIEPTVFTDVKPEMRIAQEEIFGPVLSIITVKSFEEGIKIANNIKYGLSSSIYTNDMAKALKFIKETEAGLTHVNLPTAYKEPQLPFGGIKASGVGLPEAGETGIEFFTEHKTVYINYASRKR